MKIALISFLLGPEGGGASIVVERLRDAYLRDGLEVIVITTHPRRRLEVTMEKGARTYRFFPGNLYWVGNKDSKPKALRAIWQLVDIWNPYNYFVVNRILEAERPDIVHVHKLRGLSPSVWRAAKSAGNIPVVHTCHDFELISPMGTLEGRIGKWAEQGAFPLNIYQLLRRRFSNFVDMATAPSQFVMDKHTEKGYFHRAQRSIIPNTHGYSLEQIEEHRSLMNQAQLDHSELRLLFVGRLEPEKGVLTLVEAAQQTLESGSNIRLDIVGSGSLETSLRDRLTNNSAIHIHGPRFGASKGAFLKNTDLVIVPSEVQESFGLVVVEAYAFGKPVLVSQIGALPDLVEEGKTGFVFEPRDAIAIKNLIIKLSGDRTILRDMTENCFNAAQEFCVEGVRDLYLGAYKSA
jgi:glycosyltransferase involved in cell wall biosynthesis